MIKQKKFYITTTIPYANAFPHIGFTLEIVQADVLARWYKQDGYDIFFLTGTDEHGTKNYQTAKKQKLTPQAFVDKNSAQFKRLTKDYNILNNYFIRTTDKKVHWPGVVQMWKRLAEKGDIYKKKYEGYYCKGCERFVTEKDLVSGRCPNHPNLKIEHVAEENYFFKLSKYSNQIKKLIESNKLKIHPTKYKNDFLSLIKDGLLDVSFSRNKKHLPWGIPVPGDSSQVMYVWCDALTNYLTGIKYPDKDYQKWWPADIHAVGKDMLRFHAGIWPGMLLSAGFELPKEITVHGWVTAEGRKMSKSLGNVVDPFVEAKAYGVDSVRYYLLREIPTGGDGDYSRKAVVSRINNELANELGNLVSRSLTLIEREGGKVPEGQFELGCNMSKIQKCVDNRELHKALDEIWAYISKVNEYIAKKQPWTKPEDLDDILFNMAESLRWICALTWPFIPKASENIAKQLGIKRVPTFADLKKHVFGHKVKKCNILFKKVEYVEPKVEYSGKKVVVQPKLLKKIKSGELSVGFAEFKGLNVKTRSGALERAKQEVMKKLDVSKVWDVINSYRYIVEEGRDRLNADLSSENLMNYVQSTGKLPNINTVTDAYNIISLKTGIIMGVYDVRGIHGDVVLKETDGSEYFIEIGKKAPEKIHPGEYVVADSADHVVTKWVTKQSDDIKITPVTKGAVLCVQGNKNISQKELNKVLKEVADTVVRYCGGEYKILFSG